MQSNSNGVTAGVSPTRSVATVGGGAKGAAGWSSSLSRSWHALGGTPAVALFLVLVTLLLGGVLAYAFDWGIAEDYLMVDWYRRLVVTGEWSVVDLLPLRNGAHPLAFQALISTITIHLLGVHFSAIVILNAIVIAATIASLYVLMAPALRSMWAKLGLMLSTAFFLFHPSQTNHILWAFEIGWFLVTLFLVLALAAAEKERATGLLLAAVFCLLATFCSAQGAFVWLAVAAQLSLSRRRAALVFLGGFLASAVFAGGGQGGLTAQLLAVFSDFPGSVLYLLQLLGTVFGIRSNLFTAAAGTVAAILAAAALVVLFRSYPTPTRYERVAAGLLVYSIGATLGFALGRFQFGIEWAMHIFHATPLVSGIYLVPLLMAVRRADAATEWKRVRRPELLLVGTFCGASVLAALPYAKTRAEEAQTFRALGMRTHCYQGFAPYLAAEFIGLAKAPHALVLVTDNWSLLAPLCRPDVPERASALQMLPSEFERRIRENPALEEPLHDLWNVYGYRVDLQRAFPLSDPRTPQRLIQFARNNAQSGSQYETSILEKHARAYLEIR